MTGMVVVVVGGVGFWVQNVVEADEGKKVVAGRVRGGLQAPTPESA